MLESVNGVQELLTLELLGRGWWDGILLPVWSVHDDRVYSREVRITKPEG
jgi:hypothetical protein